ncbi:potassium channel-like protein [Amylocarpus encephaloides]|uniref:Potassium channel-like protein n=1 Tax=Amylocarpus encephaloides TaxID=45428 RepID=A0A9P8C2L1_9HELO|nr:potassium channel-like protein [Amylocarpus encephaloides]
MNDPGLDDPIADRAEDVEYQYSRGQGEGEEDEQAYLEPALWWFASTAFPLIAGTFGPMASAFSICALAGHWRQEIQPGENEETSTTTAPDPKWLLIVNAIQLAVALASNLFLLLNMARRVRFSIAQPITIIGWYVSSFALLGLCACAAGPLVIQPRSQHAFSQAFYYAIFAAGLYFICASLMLVTVWGAYRGHYAKEFQLTISQRTLMLQTISFLTYLLCGAAVYTRVEGWKFYDAVYFVDYTLLTIGIGNLSPETHLGRSLLFPFAIGGIIILGLVIGSIRSLVLERGKVKMGARMVEKERRRLLKKLYKNRKDDLLKPIHDTERRQSHQSSTQHEKQPQWLNERQRRHREFKLMRKVQAEAQQKRRWTSLAISGATWLALWLVGAAIFQKCEQRQDWSYFVSLYFAYTSLLTIGYGDFYPTSNSGKAFFVFWSLLAIPSLTILISNMGDTIVKVIRDLTLWVGNVTLLPGDKGFKSSLKESINKLSLGKLFSDYDPEEAPPGILGDSKRRHSSSSNQDEGRKSHKNDPESAAQKEDFSHAKEERKSALKRGKHNDKLPSSKHHYHLMLIKEISSVIQHLNSSPSREYSFEEWAWYLKLVGEDEDDARMHRKPINKPKGEADHEGFGGLEIGTNGSEPGEEAKPVKWSWVGNRSPLMGNKEEAEWVLERLTKTLERELQSIRDEEMERKQSSNLGESSGDAS